MEGKEPHTTFKMTILNTSGISPDKRNALGKVLLLTIFSADFWLTLAAVNQQDVSNRTY